jgi:ATP-binding cassette subfamily B protein
MIKFTHYKQPDEMACGATCLRMVAKHYGKNYSLSNIIQLSGTTSRGV